ncbi:NUDIX hydrolase [Bacillus sp. A301a_S52]|nr:NUDIX hydrolase [Bacillus sp. A301a_S52]
MDNEQLKIFDEDRNEIGVASRGEVHKLGYWHETFHCWFTTNEEGIDYIYFQIRSSEKQDYPNLLDITAAGHLLVDETICDGIREVQEETGIKVSFDELIGLGVIKYCVERNCFIDKEFANVFLYQSKNTFNDFKVQRDEVLGIVRAQFKEFYQFCLQEKEDIRIEGFELNKSGRKVPIDKLVNKNHFVPHENAFYEKVAKLIKKTLNL